MSEFYEVKLAYITLNEAGDVRILYAFIYTTFRKTKQNYISRLFSPPTCLHYLKWSKYNSSRLWHATTAILSICKK
jgi:hypothetical protein